MKTIKANYKVIIGVMVFIGLMWMVFGKKDDAGPADGATEPTEAKIEVKLRTSPEDYKAIGVNTVVKADSISVTYGAFEKTSKWIFDRYDDTYMQTEPERGDICITGKATVTSAIKNPMLPQIIVFKMQDSMLVPIAKMGYRFSRWQDYGYYLGNYHDKNNDFAYTEKISFECGVMINEDVYKNEVLFIAAENSGCGMRVEKRFDQPPVSYTFKNCKQYYSIAANAFDNDLTLLKVINKEKIK